jgi:hypothetical protein
MPDEDRDFEDRFAELLRWYAERGLDPNNQALVRPWRRWRDPGDNGDG